MRELIDTGCCRAGGEGEWTSTQHVQKIPSQGTSQGNTDLSVLFEEGAPAFLVPLSEADSSSCLPHIRQRPMLKVLPRPRAVLEMLTGAGRCQEEQAWGLTGPFQ